MVLDSDQRRAFLSRAQSAVGGGGQVPVESGGRSFLEGKHKHTFLHVGRNIRAAASQQLEESSFAASQQLGESSFAASQQPEEESSFAASQQPEEGSSFAASQQLEEGSSFAASQQPEEESSFAASQQPEEGSSFAASQQPEEGSSFAAQQAEQQLGVPLKAAGSQQAQEQLGVPLKAAGWQHVLPFLPTTSGAPGKTTPTGKTKWVAPPSPAKRDFLPTASGVPGKTTPPAKKTAPSTVPLAGGKQSSKAQVPFFNSHQTKILPAWSDGLLLCLAVVLGVLLWVLAWRYRREHGGRSKTGPLIDRGSEKAETEEEPLGDEMEDSDGAGPPEVYGVGFCSSGRLLSTRDPYHEHDGGSRRRGCLRGCFRTCLCMCVINSFVLLLKPRFVFQEVVVVQVVGSVLPQTLQQTHTVCVCCSVCGSTDLQTYCYMSWTQKNQLPEKQRSFSCCSARRSKNPK